MKVYKLRCLRNFLKRIKVGLEKLVEFVASQESYVRGCYEETIDLNVEKFSELILLDGVFIVELFLKNHSPGLRKTGDIIFQNGWICSDLLHDMLLLENQLPIRVTEGLLRNFVDRSYLNGITLYELAHEFFKDVGNTEKLQLTAHCYYARHFVEFLLFLHRTPCQKKQPAEKFEYTPSVTELRGAGVKFRCADGAGLFKVEFEKGKLTLPRLIVNDSTETFFRNLIAFEQCGHQCKQCGHPCKCITSYVILMDSLINTADDVALLVKHGIIQNKLGEYDRIAKFINNLCKEVVIDTIDFYFAKLCEDLNQYSRDRVHELKSRCFRWTTMLKRDYFSNPWSCISLVAASVLLILTVIQTACSIFQVEDGRGK